MRRRHYLGGVLIDDLQYPKNSVSQGLSGLNISYWVNWSLYLLS
jgi:hypothetical protein